jgi:hypothetical protein
MAIALQYSTDRGSNWTTLSTYTHPTSAGVYPIPIRIGGLFKTHQHTISFRLYGTDAANWGLYDWKVYAPVRVMNDGKTV